MDLSEREYNCEHCGLVIDRDLNAALNLEQLRYYPWKTFPLVIYYRKFCGK